MLKTIKVIKYKLLTKLGYFTFNRKKIADNDKTRRNFKNRIYTKYKGHDLVTKKNLYRCVKGTKLNFRQNCHLNEDLMSFMSNKIFR